MISPSPSARLRQRRALVVLVALATLASGCGNLVEVTASEPVVVPAQAQTTAVVDAAGAPLADLHAEQDRVVIPLADMPPALRDAVLAVEDTRFYDHGGLDVRAIARAAHANQVAGRVEQGGSTITQQLAKHAFTGGEQTLGRKVREAAGALQLEHHLSKDDILAQYLNIVYFGNGAYGVQSAATRYFGVDADQLSLPQAALLAALLKGPANYDPYSAPAAAKRRRDLVLRLMSAQGRVPAAVAEQARRAPLGVLPERAGPRSHRAAHFVDHVLAELQHDPAYAVLGATPGERADRIYRGGLRIETTLDATWQAAAEEAARRVDDVGEGLRAAVVALDPGTGSIRAMVGGPAEQDVADPTAHFNLATQGRRQPGSTFKPLVLAAALARGHRLDDLLPAPAELVLPAAGQDGQDWEVRNHGGVDLGALSLRAGLALSSNVVYAQLIDEVGPAGVARLAEAAGVRRPLPSVRSLALGAVEVSPLELAAIQSTFAGGGVYREPSAITRILAPDGTVLWTRPDPLGERVMDPGIAWLTTQALGDVIAYGTGAEARLARPVAGKTGTSQEGADAWFAGYTPDLAAAVWVGFPEGRVPMVPPRTDVAVEGGTLPAQIFAELGAKALQGTPPSDFAYPEGALLRVRVDTTRGCLAGPGSPPELIAEQAYLPGTEPTTPCAEEEG